MNLYRSALFQMKTKTFLKCFVRGCSLGAGSGTASGVEFSSWFFIGNIFLLKLLKIFSLARRNNLPFFRKDLFSTGILPLPVFLNLLTNWICSLSPFFYEKISSYTSLIKTKIKRKFYGFLLFIAYSRLSNLVYFVLESFYYFNLQKISQLVFLEINSEFVLIHLFYKKGWKILKY